jgi:hypothetical protein
MNFRYANSVFDRPLSAASATNIVEFPNAPNRMLLSDPVSKWREAAGKRLNELIRLECGWDGYRGAPVSFEIAYFTIQLLEAACGPMRPFPKSCRGLPVTCKSNGTRKLATSSLTFVRRMMSARGDELRRLIQREKRSL